MKRIFLVSLLFLSLASFGQKEDPFLKKIGALKKENRTTKDTSVVNILNETAMDSAYSNSRKAENYSRIALGIAKKIEYYKGQNEALLNLSRAKIYLNDFDSAMFFADQSLAIATSIKSDEYIIKSFEMKGSIDTYTESWESAVKNYLTASERAERTNPKLALTSYANLGLVFKRTKNIQKSEKYIRLSLKLAEKYKDTSVIATSLNNLGLHEYHNNKDYDGALKQYKRGLDLSRKIGDLKRQSEILHNMANVYYDMGKHEEGHKHFEESLELSKVSESHSSLAISYYTLATNSLTVNDLKKAEDAAFTALDYAILSKSHEILMESHALLAYINRLKGDNDQAYSHLSHAFVYKDSLNLTDVNNAIVDAEEKYEKEKQKIKNDLKLANEKKINAEKLWWRDLFLWISIAILCIVIVGVYYLMRINKQIKLKSATVEQQKEELTIQHKEITSSIDYAKRIQLAMFSNKNQWEEISPKHSIFFKPKDVVSGDFYWAYKNTQKDISIWAVADCTGHGVPGAFMSMLGIGFLNEIVIENGQLDPAEILNSLRSKIVSSLDKDEQDNKDGMDISICVYHHGSNKLFFAGANNPLWIITQNPPKNSQDVKSTVSTSDGYLIEIAPDKMPIGKLFSVPPPFSTKEIELNKGDVIISFSDGFADQFGGAHDKKFKYKSFKELMLEIQKKPFVQHTEILEEAFENWKGTHEQTDDVCVVLISFD